MQLSQIKIFECLVRRDQTLCHAATTLRIDHIWEKTLAQQTEQGPDLSHQRPQMLYELGK
jgi:hypothetical protein